MIRLAVSVEGQTEEEFVKKVLAAHLSQCAVAVYPILLGRARNSGAGGGNVTVERLVLEMSHLCYSFDAVTSLVDFYGFKGKGDATNDELQEAVRHGVESKTGRNGIRIIPYVQRYEFESLLFSDICAFPATIEISPEAIETLKSIRLGFPTPEDINDNAATAPSRRVTNAAPQYRKRLHGPLIAEEAGMDKIRAECPRFNAWVGMLETLQDRLKHR